MLKNFLEKFVFFPEQSISSSPESLQLPFQNIYLTNPENPNQKFHGWLMEITSSDLPNPLQNYIILFFHGNAGNISYRLPFFQKMYQYGINLLMFDYPGFGNSDGSPNEENCISTGILFYNFLTQTKMYNPSNIILWGESIGGPISSSVSIQTNSPKLIVQSSFTDIKIIIKHLLSKIPSFVYSSIGFQTKNTLRKRHKTKRRNWKTLVIHSIDDELIPYEHGQILSRYADDFITCNGNHCSPKMNKEFMDKIIQFITST